MLGRSPLRLLSSGFRAAFSHWLGPHILYSDNHSTEPLHHIRGDMAI
jgi:hypothetical protein